MLLISVLAAAVLITPPADRGNLHGEVAIEAGSNSVAIYVDTNGNDSFDHRFQLAFQRHDPAAAIKLERELGLNEPRPQSNIPPRRHFERANVEFESDYVRVIADGEAFEFSIEGATTLDWNPAGARVWRRSGYGLSHAKFESNIPISRSGRDRSITAEWCDASSDCDGGTTDGGGGGQTTGGSGTMICDSGGVGSTSCSQQTDGSASCSVTCATGYYACCRDTRPPSCKCVRG